MHHNLFPFGTSVATSLLLAEDASVLLVGAAIKSFMLLAVTMVASWLVRKRSAEAKHRIWTLGFAGCLVIPIISLVAPTWNPPLIPDFLRTILSDGDEAMATPVNSWMDGTTPGLARQDTWLGTDARIAENRLANPDGWRAIADSAGVPVNAPVGSDAPQSNDIVVDARPITNQPVRTKTSSDFELSWTRVCSAVWSVGVLFCLFRTLWQQLALARVMRRGVRISSEEWTTAANRASDSLGLNRTVRLLRLPDVQSPISAGIFRATIVLPNDADDWDTARRHLVLLHELAHVKRRDVLIQTVAGFVCALHWFNPICWFGLFQMRKLREVACDDLVLASGQRPVDYADVLLDVARSYRHRNFATAVGMAHGANVESRILAVLDRARSRVAMTRRAARTLLLTAIVFVLLIGSMRLHSQDVPPPASSPDGESATTAAESPNSPPDENAGANADGRRTANRQAAEPAAADKGMRTMEISVRDASGEPIEGARVHVSVWYVKDYKGVRIPKNHFTNADGLVALEVPRQLLILRVWASKAMFVPEFVNFGQGTHDEGKRIPDRFEFRLAQGTQLSGRVVDERGQSIAGVAVNVSVDVREPAWGVNPRPMISTWLTDEDFNEPAAVTDERGYWKIVNAPAQSGAKDFEFRLMLKHEHYTSDSQWGELQNQQKVTTAMLREGSATIVMKRGVALVGRAFDPEANPVTKGLVIWHDSPYLSSGDYEAEIDDTGRFETAPLPPGVHPITVVAPGFRPERRMVTVKESMGDIRFDLQPGKRLTLKIVDHHGDPILGAHVSILKWGEAESLYNWQHPNVLDSRIPRQSDKNGVYEWNWAPDDAVTYQVSAEEFSSSTVTLIAGEETHTVQLKSRLIAQGRVTDARTGNPIKEFRVVPVVILRPKLLSTLFRREVPGNEGRYEIELSDDGKRDYRYQVRIDADGYRSAISENSYALGDGRVNVDFVLEPAAAREGRVVTDNEEPVASASVVLGTPSIVPRITNTELESGGRKIETSADGGFRLAATFEPVRVRVTHESGFADVLRQPNETIGTIQLQPWASVRGRLLQDGKPIPDQTIYFFPIVRGELGEPRFQDSYHARSNADGRFELNRLPPIAGTLRANLGPWQESPLTSSQAVPLDLKPDEKKLVYLGGKGTTVTGKVVATGRGDAELNKNWSLNYLIRRDLGIELPEGSPTLSFDPAGPVQASWFLDPNHAAWVATRANYFVKLAPDGRLHISGVPAGVYDLVLRLYEQPAGCLVETIGEKVVTVEVMESDVATGTKDIEIIEVECRAGPRVGENMQIYRFVDANGRERSLEEMKGRYVLMHVWASWCAPCLQSLPDIHATITDLSDEPITFVGLNIDGDVTKAKSLAQRRGWSWSQSYLGDDSDMARQLAISSVPTYFLIGRDGLLAASAQDWLEMKDKINAALKGTHD